MCSFTVLFPSLLGGLGNKWPKRQEKPQVCMEEEIEISSLTCFSLLFGQPLWFVLLWAAKFWVFGAVQSQLSREIARQIGLILDGLCTAQRICLCFLAAEKTAFWLFTGEMYQDWCLVPASLHALHLLLKVLGADLGRRC